MQPFGVCGDPGVGKFRKLSEAGARHHDFESSKPFGRLLSRRPRPRRELYVCAEEWSHKPGPNRPLMIGAVPVIGTALVRSAVRRIFGR